jgi:hypothetical protein
VTPTVPQLDHASTTAPPFAQAAAEAAAPTGGMTSADWMRLLGWKARQAAWRQIERAGGTAPLRQRARAWAKDWADDVAHWRQPMLGWLARPGGGRFWMGDEGPYSLRDGCPPEDLRLADAAVSGVFDLLGSGPVLLGHEPAWRRDLYSGYEWPLEASAGYRLTRGGGSDIRTVWELSRGYHLLALARAYRASGEARYVEAFLRHVDSWIEQNPLGRGPHWASPMDVGIRAANWIVALHGFADDTAIPIAFWERMLENLYASGLYLERHLEWHPVYRGNHFVANGVGLVYLGSLFPDGADGWRWLREGAELLVDEMEYQVGDDGVSFEASIAYHRLVTELFAYGGELMRLNLPGGLPAAYEAKLRKMYGFIASYLPPSGEAPMLGDADDGRLHAVSARGWLEPRRHALGLPERYWPGGKAGPSAHPAGGFFVLRGGDHHAVVRCGRVGIRGAGSHDHNDQLSLELVLGGARVLADSGTYAYTRDLAARHAYRSTAAHSVVQLGGEEQNPIRADRPWRVLEDRARARCVGWAISEHEQRFVGEHRGYAHRPSGAVCRRAIALYPRTGVCEIVDEVLGTGRDELAWRLHFGRGTLRHLSSDGTLHRYLFRTGERDVTVDVELPDGLYPRVAASRESERYGKEHLRPLLVAEGAAALPLRIETRFTLNDR